MKKIRVLVINDNLKFVDNLNTIIDDYPIIELTHISSAESFIDVQVNQYDLILLDFVLTKKIGEHLVSGTCRPMYDYIKKIKIDCVLMVNSPEDTIPSYYQDTDIWFKKEFHRVPYLIMERIIKRK